MGVQKNLAMTFACMATVALAAGVMAVPVLVPAQVAVRDRINLLTEYLRAIQVTPEPPEEESE